MTFCNLLLTLNKKKLNHKMPHQCVHCGKVYPDAAEELLKGCVCSSHFFYYIKKELIEKAKDNVQEKIEQLDQLDKKKVEKDVREIMGIEETESIPVILDLESVRVLEPGKYELDIVNLFSKKRPLIYKLEEGKYIIDLASTIRMNAEDLSFEE